MSLYLFVSNQCAGSIKVLRFLQGSPLLNFIQIMPIDNPNIQIPPFIQMVPSLYIEKNRMVISNEDEIIQTLSQIKLPPSVASSQPQQPQQPQYKQSSQAQYSQPQPQYQPQPPPQLQQQPQQQQFESIANITGDANIMPFMTDEMSSTSQYSFLDESVNNQVYGNYGYLDGRDTTSQIAQITSISSGTQMPSGNNGSGGGGKRGRNNTGGSDPFKEMEARRNADIPTPPSRL